MLFESFIAKRYLSFKQKQAFIYIIALLSTGGVALGVMALITVIAVMTGVEKEMKRKILGIDPHMIVMKQGGGFSEYNKINAILQKTEGVISTNPFVYSQVMLKASAGVSGSILKGIGAEYTTSKDLFKKNNLHKIFLKLSAYKSETEKQVIPGIILGKQLADNLKVSSGNTIYIISQKGMISPIGIVPSMKRFKVIDTFETGMYYYDESLSYILLKDAQKIMRMKDTVTGIAVWTDDIYSVEKISEKIMSEIKHPYWVQNFLNTHQDLFSALKLEKTAMFIILMLIVLVAAFNIASSLIMMVMKKKRDIGILKAMGATNRSIKKIFIFNGLAIGFTGTVIGVISGSALCFLIKHYKFIELPKNVYPFSTIPVALNFTDVLFIAFSTILICFFASLYPAHQATKIDPVEAIRYE